MNYCTGCFTHHCQTNSKANASSLSIRYLSVKLYYEHTVIISRNLSRIHSSVSCVLISDTSLSCHLTFKWRYGWYTQPDKSGFIQLDFLYYSGTFSPFYACAPHQVWLTLANSGWIPCHSFNFPLYISQCFLKTDWSTVSLHRVFANRLQKKKRESWERELPPFVSLHAALAPAAVKQGPCSKQPSAAPSSPLQLQ